jgi:hypothetical protein
MANTRLFDLKDYSPNSELSELTPELSSRLISPILPLPSYNFHDVFIYCTLMNTAQ